MATKKVNAPLAKPIKEAAVAPQTISLRTRLFRGYVGIAAAGLLILGLSAHTIPYFPWDLIIAKAIQSLPFIKNLMVWVSLPGNPPQAAIITVIALIFMAIAGLYWEALAGAIGFAAMELLVNFLKSIVGRTRPLASLVNVYRPLSGGSFPSGHVVDYVVVLGFFWFLTFSSFKKTLWLRTALLIFFSTLIILVGPSRIYLGAHWPSDVLGAYLLGTILLWGLVELYTWGKKKHFLRSSIEQSPGS